MQDNSLLNDIIVKAITGEELSSAENAILEEWLTDEENSKLFGNLKNKDYLLQKLIEAHEIDVEGDKALLEQKLQFGKHLVIPGKRQWKLFRDVATSAAAVLLLAAAIFWLFIRKPAGKEDGKEKTPGVVINDVEPGKTAALLTLADGSTKVLDTTVTGQLAQQGSTVVVNENGILKYQGNNQLQNEGLVNTLSTANAQTYSMVLHDGSKVWLNTGASIKYPVAFTGNERKVEVSGEVYFEVAPLRLRSGQKMPFIVHVTGQQGPGMDVQVLGTHFNINAYNDEAVIKTTLLEGSVKVKQGNSETLLAPGQQAQVGNGVTKVIPNANVEAAVAWVNGKFSFNNADITTVTAQLKKWYDIEIEYEGAEPAQKLDGGTFRNQMLSQTVRLLELSSGIHFRIEGRKLIVSSPK